MLGLIDESVPISALGVHYVISAAVLLDPDQREDVRARATKLIGTRKRPFHWKDEGVEKRRAMIQLLGELEVGVFATIHHPVAPKRQRRARRTALTDLVMRLGKEGVDELVVETRGALDVEDHQTLLDARRDGVCPAELTYNFRGKDEPMLWLPDAVAGLLGEAERRIKGDLLADLQRAVQIFDVRRLEMATTRTSPGSRPSRTRRSLGAGSPGLHFQGLSALAPSVCTTSTRGRQEISCNSAASAPGTPMASRKATSAHR